MSDHHRRLADARQKLLPILERYAQENELTELELASVLTTVVGALGGGSLPQSRWRRFANEAADSILEWARVTKRDLDALAKAGSAPH